MADVVGVLKEIKCVVCGELSHREDWAKNPASAACDSHSKEEVANAVAKAKQAGSPAPVAPSNTGVKPPASGTSTTTTK